jgi:hypothetical protein
LLYIHHGNIGSHISYTSLLLPVKPLNYFDHKIEINP